MKTDFADVSPFAEVLRAYFSQEEFEGYQQRLAMDEPTLPVLNSDQLADFFRNESGENDLDCSRSLMAILARYYQLYVPFPRGMRTNFRGRWYREIMPGRRDRFAPNTESL